jgi:hypothetical protein
MTPIHERVRYKTFDQLTFADLEVFTKLPAHPFWSHVADKIDFSFADRLCAVLYTGRGQYPYAPSLKLKVHLVQGYYNLSDRQVEEKIIGDLFIKRFLGLNVDFFGFDHSTIGLDRNRMGHWMFQACHMYVLAQMLCLGLWGDKNEQWIIDSFPSYAHAVTQGSYRLIQQAMVRIVRHLERVFRNAYDVAMAELDLDQMEKSIPKDAKPHERLLAFSKLTAQAHSLLNWFNTEQAIKLMGTDKEKEDPRSKSQEHRQVLQRILQDYTREAKPSNDEPGPDADSSKPEDGKPTAVSEGVRAEDGNTPPVPQSAQGEDSPKPEDGVQATEETRVE